MRKYSLFFMISILLIILGGCNELVTTDDLIEGKWIPKSGYKDGKATNDKPACPPFDKGIEFKDEETVYVESGDKDFEYYLREASYGMEINFLNPNGEFDFFEIIIENEDNLALIGSGASESYNCYFEREK